MDEKLIKYEPKEFVEKLGLKGDLKQIFVDYNEEKTKIESITIEIKEEE